MPKATLTVQASNNLLLTFNDTLYQKTVNENDLYIQIFGSSLYYNFNWNASFISSTQVKVEMEIITALEGNQDELVILEFL